MTEFTSTSRSSDRRSSDRIRTGVGRMSWRAALAVVAGLTLAVVPVGATGAGAALTSTHETVLSTPGLGRAVSVYGDTIVAGGTDAAFVYSRGAGGWALETTLRPSDGAPGDRFGAALSIQGSFVVIGAPGATVDGKPGAGAAYVFARLPDGTWFQWPRLVSPSPSAGAHFGAAVDTSGETEVVVGAPGAGTATVFTRDTVSGDWVLNTQLGAPGLTPSGAIAAGFGSSVAISSDLLSVGAPGLSVAVAPATLVAHAGTVFAFLRVGSMWSLDGRLVDSPPVTNGHFGQVLAKESGSTIVGAPGSQSISGFAFQGPGVYTPLGRDLGGTGFGSAIGAGAGEAVAGDPAARSAYLYANGPTGVTLVGTLIPSSGPKTDGFGTSVDSYGSVVVVGAPGTQTIHVFDVVDVAALDHASITLSGALSYSAAGDVLGNLAVTRSAGRVTAVSGAGRIANLTAQPLVGFDLHPFGKTRLLSGDIRIRDAVTGFVHDLFVFSIANQATASHTDGLAIGVDRSFRPTGLIVVRWSIDDLAP